MNYKLSYTPVGDENLVDGVEIGSSPKVQHKVEIYGGAHNAPSLLLQGM